jgi:hypothetical protein
MTVVKESSELMKLVVLSARVALSFLCGNSSIEGELLILRLFNYAFSIAG